MDMILAQKGKLQSVVQKANHEAFSIKFHGVDAGHVEILFFYKYFSNNLLKIRVSLQCVMSLLTAETFTDVSP